jgi:predicted DNA-binding protein YlxM (UPF0122 family)
MNIFAVITGDIIKSSKIREEERSHLLNELKTSFEKINERFIKAAIPPFEIYRGDSFQIVLQEPQQALLIGFIIRAKLRSITTSEKKEVINYWDARISIGIGSIAYQGEKIVESDGEAFQLSGRGLDEMKKRNSLGIRTRWPAINEEFEVACALSETIVDRWTVSQAKVIYSYLLENKTQQELAEEFDITQGAISQRITTAGNIDAIKLFIQRYEKLISSRCTNNSH